MKRLVLPMLVALTIAVLANTSALAARATGEDWRLTKLNSIYEVGNITWGSWYSGGVQAGAFYVKVEDFVGKPGDPPQGAPNTVYYAWVYCIEAEAIASPDWYKKLTGQKPLPPDQSKPEIGDDNWARKVWLIQNYGWDSLSSPAKSAGMQLAIWEVVSDDDFDLDNGVFKIQTGQFPQARPYAEQYLNAVKNIDWTTVDITKDICYTDGQNLNEVPVIPEASTLLLAFTGIGSIAGFRRLRKG
ncbi:MAG: hypothetical protein QHI38_07035 [Armatimonadota bacterium]|nr:hypothetical protein [Armatimonadota bacterium]